MKYQVLKGFAGVTSKKEKVYFSPENQHLISTLPAAEISKHIKAGNIAELDAKAVKAAEAAAESTTPSEPETVKSSAKSPKGGKQ